MRAGRFKVGCPFAQIVLRPLDRMLRGLYVVSMLNVTHTAQQAHMEELESYYSDGQRRPITDGWVRTHCPCGHVGETTTWASRDGSAVHAECESCDARLTASLA